MNEPSTTWQAEAARPSATGATRVIALDGVRAVGLLLIMGFHFGVPGMTGGYVGVDTFYVLSGYLITGLLLGEWARAARIKLGQFWIRRARRLLPALVVVVITVTLVVRFTYFPGTYPDLRMADLSALFYFSNWWQIATSGSYFAITGPVSPLTHTWSLAVEEQFYLVWPLVTLAVLRIGRRFDRGIEILLGVSVAGIIASATEMAVLYGTGANTTRLYFGTDTHAQSILTGTALACVMTLIQRHRGLPGMAPVAGTIRVRTILTALGLTGAAGTLVLTVTMSGTSSFAYHGGFLLSALSAAAIIVGAVCMAGGPIARVLSFRPLVWIGTVSYGGYLWHYPVGVELDSARTNLSGPSLLVLRVVVTFTLAAASYYLIERPIIEGVFWRSVKAAAPAVATIGVTVIVVVVATVAPAAAVNGAGATGAGLSPGVRAELTNRSAFTTKPIRFLLLGDSVALTLGLGLGNQSVPRYGVQTEDAAVLGCQFDSLSYINDGLTYPHGFCRRWRSSWAKWVAVYHPNVVGLLMGRWEITDQIDHKRVVSIGEPGWDRHLLSELETAITILSAGGARVVLFTSPYFDPPEAAPNGDVFPENQPARVVEWNKLVEEAAARYPGVASVIDLNALVDPGGHYQAVVDGVTVRWPDGIHISDAGGEWLQPDILPTVAALGLASHVSGS